MKNKIREALRKLGEDLKREEAEQEKRRKKRALKELALITFELFSNQL